MFNKSDFKAFLSCRREFWLSRNHPGAVSRVIDPSLAFRIRQGYEVQRIANGIFPDAATEQTFQVGDVSAKVDQFEAITGGGYVLREVKSGKTVSQEYLFDIAFQVFVARAAGADVRRAELVCPNGDYRRSGTLDPRAFIAVHDATADVDALLPEVEATIEAMRQSMATEPDGSFENLCDSKLHCQFFKWRGDAFPDHTIYDLFPRSSVGKITELEMRGVIATRDIPDNFELTPKQRSVVEVLRAGVPLIDHERLRASLSRLRYPLYFLDYETVNPAIPQFDGMAPLEQIAFQYSLHVLESPGSRLEHFEFVSDGSGVPGLEMVENLRRAIGPEGSVIVWNESFEATRNKELLRLYPQFAEFLGSVNSRMFDLMKIFSDGIYRHPMFAGRSSIKLVLPVLVPELSYEGMDIGDGGSAMGRWFDDVFRGSDEQRKQSTLQSLREYCRLDSLAMAEILARINEN